MAKNTYVETLRTEAVRPLYVAAGVTDLAVEIARGYVSETQKRVTLTQKRVQSVDLEPKALQAKARELVNTGIDELSKEAKARQTRVEKAVAELGDTYDELAARGEKLVSRIRSQQATKDATSSAKTTVAQAKGTATTAKKSAKTASSQVKGATTTARKSTKSAAKRSTTATKTAAKKTSTPAKATSTSAQKTAAKTAQAVSDGASKVGN